LGEFNLLGMFWKSPDELTGMNNAAVTIPIFRAPTNKKRRDATNCFTPLIYRPFR
jgi:hypothetical protein